MITVITQTTVRNHWPISPPLFSEVALFSSPLFLFLFTSLSLFYLILHLLRPPRPGPSFWGRLNPKWNLCSKGKKQSPIDVNPAHLLFDPSLASLDITGNEVRPASNVISFRFKKLTFCVRFIFSLYLFFLQKVSGNLTHTGRGIVFKVAPKLTDLDPEVTISAGPLSYRYTLHHLELHFGRDISRGSEHSIDSFRYPGGEYKSGE